MSRIAFSILYAGLQLPIAKNAQQQDITPLKPISDLFGLSWSGQRKKVTENPYLKDYLGIEIADSGDASPTSNKTSGDASFTSGARNPTYLPPVFIKVNRVAAYLMSISPANVHAQGNADGARYLIEKQHEWADALHDYEEIGVAINLNHAKTQDALRRQRLSFAQMIGLKNKTPDVQDRQALSRIIGQMATELGVSYQLEFGEQPKTDGASHA